MLKPQMDINQETMALSAVAIEPGKAVVATTQAGGSGLGDGLGERAVRVLQYAGAPAEDLIFVGIAIDEVVTHNQNLVPRSNLPATTRFAGEPFRVATSGSLVTNSITGNPAVGGLAYLAANSTFGVAPVNVGDPAVGIWETAKDGDGYAKILVKR